MSLVDHIKGGYALADMIQQSYLGDLEDADLLRRPTEGANHIAWQLGHLAVAENGMINQVCPDSMPPLPEDFQEKYTKETSALDGAENFHTKEEYLKVLAEQRAGTVAALEKLSEEELAKPAPEKLQRIGSDVAAIFGMQSAHVLMHVGQWVIVRRQLGKPALF